MGISHYLAMTAAETEAFSLPEGYLPAYMACHFSPYSTGLSNIPTWLPSGSMLMVNDRIPICGHDPERIAREIGQAVVNLHCGCVLLDMQRPGQTETAVLCEHLVSTLSCPVGVSELYGKDLRCPLFLPPLPLDTTPEEHLSPWKGRELWLDIAPDAACICVTEAGSTLTPIRYTSPPENAFPDDSLHCHYRADILPDRITFHLWRDLGSLTRNADRLGVTKCVGLYQEFHSSQLSFRGLTAECKMQNA